MHRLPNIRSLYSLRLVWQLGRELPRVIGHIWHLCQSASLGPFLEVSPVYTFSINRILKLFHPSRYIYFEILIENSTVVINMSYSFCIQRMIYLYQYSSPKEQAICAYATKSYRIRSRFMGTVSKNSQNNCTLYTVIGHSFRNCLGIDNSGTSIDKRRSNKGCLYKMLSG